MKENDAPCCEESSTAASRSCCSSSECDCGKPAGRKALKVVICLIVFLMVIGIIAYKLCLNTEVRNCCDPASSSCCPEN